MISPSPLWRRSLTAVFLMCATTRPGLAQFAGMGAIQVGPDTLLLTDAHGTATAFVTNQGDQPMTLWFGIACDAASDNVLGGAISAAWQNRSTCALPWLSGYPQHLVLAPHQRERLTIQVHPPVTLPDGHYTARLIWATALVDVTPSGDTAGRAVQHDELQISYTKGASLPRQSHARWQAALPGASHLPILRHAPAILVLDDQQRSASVTLQNTSAVATEVWLAVDCPWFRVNYVDYPTSHQYESAWHGRIASAAFWLSGYPQHLLLGPYEQRTLTLTAFPDLRAGDQPDGSYYARLVYFQSPHLAVTAGWDTAFSTPGGAIDVVYHRGTVQPLTLSHVQRMVYPNGKWGVCLTVLQAGLGAVVRINAEVDDAHGRALPKLEAGGAGNGDKLQAWHLDTIVAVWNVVHHDPMDGTQDGDLKPPDPLCFPVAPIASGNNQLVITASALEDTLKRHAVRVYWKLTDSNSVRVLAPSAQSIRWKLQSSDGHQIDVAQMPGRTP